MAAPSGLTDEERFRYYEKALLREKEINSKLRAENNRLRQKLNKRNK